MSPAATAGERQTGAGQRQPAHIVNESGATVMAMNSMRREGDRLVINGTLMGAWPSDMYVEAKDVAHMIRLALSAPAVIGLVASLPYVLWRERRQAS